MEETYLKPLKFNQRIGKHTVNAYYIDFLAKQGNLKDILLKARMKDADEILFEDVMDDRMWKDKLTEEQKIEKFKLLRGKMEERHKQEIENFLPILFNQSLVMICTVFDNFLLDTLKVITKKKPETLKILSKEEDITIAEIIESADYRNIFSIIQGKVLRRFEFKGIKKKFETFEKLGLTKGLMFSLSENMKIKYPNAYEFLIDIYKKRNDIVHRDKLPLRQYQDLSNIDYFLTHFTFHISLEIKKLFNIPLDIQLIAFGKNIDIKEDEY